MTEVLENDAAASLVEACGGATPALASILQNTSVRVFVVDRNLRITRADGNLSLLFNDAHVRPVQVPGGMLLDALTGDERERWAELLQRFTSDSASNFNGYSYARPGIGGPGSFVCVSPIVLRQGQKFDGIRFITVEIPEGDIKAALGEDRPDGEPSVEEGLTVAKQLAATLNHEINNPLFVVSATLEDVLAEQLEPEMRARLQTALDKTWQAVDAVKQLQDVQQIVSTSYIPGFEMIDLEASSQRQKRPAKPAAKS